MQKKAPLLTISILSLLLGACSGGGSEKNNNDAAPAKEEIVELEETNPECYVDSGNNNAGDDLLTGQLASKISGLTYRTESLSGITDVNGGFYYRDGEQVTFCFGRHKMGSTTAKSQITLYDIAGAEPLTEADFYRSYHISTNYFDILFEKANYRAVINMAVLLQSLDYDNNLNNGIEIRPEVVKLFNKKQVNFHKRAFNFYSSTSPFWVTSNTLFRNNPLYDAFIESNQSIFSEARSLKFPQHALADLNSVLGLPSPSQLMRVDRNSTNYHLTYEYDNNGNPIYKNSFYNEESHESFAMWNDEGNKTYEKDFTGEKEYKYDSYGRIISEIKGTRITTYDWDKNIETFEIYRDTNLVYRETCKTTGNAIQKATRCEEDDNADGNIDLVALTYTTYDTYGNTILVEEDYDNDGIMDEVVSYDYDEKGNCLRTEEDRDADGVIDTTVTTVYDENSNVLLVANYAIYLGESRIVQYQYDDNNNVTLKHSISKKSEATYIGDLDAIYEYVYDGNHLMRIEGFVDDQLFHLSTYEYDTDGKMTASQEDSDNDGVLDTFATYQYDENNRLINVNYDNGIENYDVSRVYGNETTWFHAFERFY